MYKIRIQRDLFETCNKWSKWYGLSVDIKSLSQGGFLPLPRGYIHVLNHQKCVIKSDFEEIILKFATYGQKRKGLSVVIKFLSPNGLSAPAWGYIHVKKKKHKER